MSTSDDKRFDSWKEIANFLRRDLRTVRRWEEERGLPVHRVPGDGHRAVFAYRSEIEAWLEGDGRLSDNDTSTKEPNQHDLRTERYNRAVVRVAFSILIAGIAGIIVLSAASLRSRLFGRHPTRIERVSPIYATGTQAIIIDGEGFGPPPKTIRMTPEGGVDTYADSYSTSMRIDNLGEGHHKWVAGRGGPLNYCDISVKLASWTDNHIVLAGFAGPLGTSCNDVYQIAPGDRLRIVVWGPENRCGPGGPSECPEEVKAKRVATFDTVVLSSQGMQAPSCADPSVH